jgi:hypothetical protein
MKFAVFALCVSGFVSQARAETSCLFASSETTCLVMRVILPELEAKGIAVNGLDLTVSLQATEKGQPLAATTFYIFSAPMTNDQLSVLAKTDLLPLGQVFETDLKQLHCGQIAKSVAEESPALFVMAGGAVSYEIMLHLKNSASDTIHELNFGQTTIENCEAQ